MTKTELYRALVLKRKADLSMAKNGFKNQSDYPEFDTDEIGNYTTWANDLDADIMIVAQDFCNQIVFERDRGKVQLQPLENPKYKTQWDTETNYYLWKLLKSISRDIGLPNKPKKTGVFLTNAVLGLKDKKRMNGDVPKKVFNHDGQNYLQPLIEIIQPKKIITLGTGAAQAVLSLYANLNDDAKRYCNESMLNIFRRGPFKFQNFTLHPMYHPGVLGQNARKNIEQISQVDRFDLMLSDWKKL